MAAKFELYTGSGGEHRFRLKAGNGENILASEGYSSRSGAKNGIESVKTNAPIDARYEKKTSTNNTAYFVLKGGNGEPIGRSQMYASTSGRDNGIESVKTNAPGAAVADLT